MGTNYLHTAILEARRAQVASHQHGVGVRRLQQAVAADRAVPQLRDGRPVQPGRAEPQGRHAGHGPHLRIRLPPAERGPRPAATEVASWPFRSGTQGRKRRGTLEKAPMSRSSSAAGGLPLMSAPCLSSTCARSRTSCVATTARRNVPCRAGQNRPPSVPSICQPLPLLDCKLCQTLWRSLQTRSSGDAVTLQNTCTPQLWWSGSHPAKHLYSEARLDPSEAGVLSQS